MEALRRIQQCLPPSSFLGSLCFAKDESLFPGPTKFCCTSLCVVYKEERTGRVGGIVSVSSLD